MPYCRELVVFPLDPTVMLTLAASPIIRRWGINLKVLETPIVRARAFGDLMIKEGGSQEYAEHETFSCRKGGLEKLYKVARWCLPLVMEVKYCGDFVLPSESTPQKRA